MTNETLNPIEGSLRDGDKLILRNELEAQIHGGRHDGFEYDTDGDKVTLIKSSHPTKFFIVLSHVI